MKNSPFIINSGKFQTYIAQSESDIDAAQKLRYDIFYKEMGARDTASLVPGRDVRELDAYAEHLVVKDTEKGSIVGTYRLLPHTTAKKYGSFYSEGEFDISPLKALDASILEVSRSCVDKAYRNRSVISLLWRGLGEYTVHHNITHLFGCGSFAGTDIKPLHNVLSYLYHYHLLPESWRVKVWPQYFHPLNYMPKEQVDVKRAIASLPPLLKGYMRLGGFVGDGVFVDREFNTVDVCVVVESSSITPRFYEYYFKPSSARGNREIA